MKVNRNVRNIVIVLAVAAIVAIVPGGGSGASVVIQVISLAFLASIAWIASRLYREHRVAIYSLGNTRRAVVYGAVAVAILTFTASPRLLQTGAGSVAFLLLLAGSAFAVFRVVRSAREY
jgi:hypothetical protein